ncbi:hypothetical protein HK405_004829 [Cladochytrium tenue]|nr:hypothetical protein HK405_004829 [Cladochytrium tenue]
MEATATAATIAVVQGGVAGGFLGPAPLPRRACLLDLAAHPPTVRSLRGPRTRKSSEFAAKRAPADAVAAAANGLILPLATDLVALLRTLPTEDPPGSDDLYDCDTFVSLTAPGFTWRNLPNQGCAPASINASRPTPDQVDRFRDLAGRLLDLAESLATEPEEGPAPSYSLFYHPPA